MFLLGSKDLNEAKLTLRKMLTRDPLFEYFSPPPWGFYQEEIDYQEYLSAYSKVMAQARPEELELGKVFISFFLNGNGPIENSRLQTLAEKGSLMTRVLALSTLLRSEPKAEDLRRSLVRLGENLSEFGPLLTWCALRRGHAYPILLRPSKTSLRRFWLSQNRQQPASFNRRFINFRIEKRMLTENFKPSFPITPTTSQR